MQKLLEKARQALPIREREFKPTPNLRNPAMLQEAEDFGRYMLGFKNSLNRYHGSLDTFLASMPVVGNGNLPRVWDQVEGTDLCEPIRPNVSHAHPTRVGGEFDEGLLRDTRELLDFKLSRDIIGPIDRWLESLAVVRERMSRLEGLRLDVDARRRRAFHKYHRTISRMKRREGITYPEEEREREEYGLSSGADPVVDARRQEDYIRQEMYFKRKLDAVQSSYTEQEQLVWEQLSGLVRDATWLKTYVASALLAVKEALQASAFALGTCKLPLPSFPKSGEGKPYGAIGDPSDTIGDIPDVVKHGPGVAPVGLPRAITGAATDAIRPKMLTAQPLQTSADLTTPRYAPVPPVVKGMAGVPEDELQGTGRTSEAVYEQYERGQQQQQQQQRQSTSFAAWLGKPGERGSGEGPMQSLKHTIANAISAGPVAPTATI